MGERLVSIIDDEYFNLKSWDSISDLECLIKNLLSLNREDIEFCDICTCSCYMIEYYLESNPLILSKYYLLGLNELHFEVEDNLLGIESISFSFSDSKELDSLDEIYLANYVLYNIKVHLNLGAFYYLKDAPILFCMKFDYVINSNKNDLLFQNFLLKPVLNISDLYKYDMNHVLRMSLFSFLLSHNHIDLVINHENYLSFLAELTNVPNKELVTFDLTIDIMNTLFLDVISPYLMLEDKVKISKELRNPLIKNIIIEIDYQDYLDYCGSFYLNNLKLHRILDKFILNDITLRLINVPSSVCIDLEDEINNLELIISNS